MAKQKKTSVHKNTPNPTRKNGKAFKQHPKGFDSITRSLRAVSSPLKGTKF